MVHLIFFISLVASAFSPSPVKEGKAKITFEEHTIKLGDIYPGEQYYRTFKFTNTGTAPLVITDVETACSCTVVDYSKEPIMPGKSGEIKVDFIPKKDTKGFISKSFVVSSNAENSPEYLYLHGNVLQKKKK